MKNLKNELIARILRFQRQRRSRYAIVPYVSDSAIQDQISFKKGTEFETFVVKRFNRDYFTLIEWRSDKNVEGIYPMMSKFPDLEFYFESQTEAGYFAVECKWRENFFQEKISLKKNHIENYRHYESVTGNLTFLVIGVGNTPSYPKHIYIIPLQNMVSESLHEFDLEVYRRKNPYDNFYFDCRNASLR